MKIDVYAAYEPKYIFNFRVFYTQAFIPQNKMTIIE